MKKWFLICMLGTVGLGSAWHFFYVWWPHPLVGFFAPADESIWEHLKLLYWPFIPAIWVLGKRYGLKAVGSGFLVQLLWMPVFLLAVYYTASAGFGICRDFFNIALYAVTAGLGFFRAYRLTVSRRAERYLGELIMLTAVYGCALVLFTVASPELPIFQPSQNFPCKIFEKS